MYGENKFRQSNLEKRRLSSRRLHEFSKWREVRAMELLESIGWIAIGFVPTLVSLHLGYAIGAKKRRKATSIISQIQS